MRIDKHTRYSDLSLELCTLGGELLADILQDGETSLQRYKANKIEQDLSSHKDMDSDELIDITQDFS